MDDLPIFGHIDYAHDHFNGKNQNLNLKILLKMNEYDKFEYGWIQNLLGKLLEKQKDYKDWKKEKPKQYI